MGEVRRVIIHAFHLQKARYLLTHSFVRFRLSAIGVIATSIGPIDHDSDRSGFDVLKKLAGRLDSTLPCMSASYYEYHPVNSRREHGRICYGEQRGSIQQNHLEIQLFDQIRHLG